MFQLNQGRMGLVGGQKFSPAKLFTAGVQGAWFDPSDSTTLFSDRAGTTPCAAPGAGALVPVGLMLDKSQNGVGTNGAKRVNLLAYTEQFDNAAWTKSSATIDATGVLAPDGTTTADRLINAAASAAHGVYQSQTGATASLTYKLSCYFKKDSVRYLALLAWNGTATNQCGCGIDLDTQQVTAGAIGAGYSASNATITSVGGGWYVVTVNVVTPATTNDVAIVHRNTAYTSGVLTETYLGTTSEATYIWGADLRLASEAATLPLYQPITSSWYATEAGNHAIAANDTTARPELSARVNLLTYSEDISNAAWGRTNLTAASVTSLLETTTNGTHNCNQSVSFVSGVLYTVRYKIKPNGRTRVAIGGGSGLGGLASTGQFYELSGSGSVVNTLSGITATISLQTDGYYLCSLTVTASNTASITIGVYLSDGGTNLSYAGDITKGVDVTAADIRPTNIGTTIPAYQRVADQYTYDTVGFPRYLAFNGTDSAMSTPANVNLSSTDKATVFAGVRKNDNTNVNQLVELSADVTSNAGSFSMPTNDSGAGRWATYLRGSAGFVSASATGTTAPITTVNTGLYDIALSADEVKLRINGAQVATSGASDAGTGNFGTYPLFIGARNNSSLFFNGSIYSLIVAGSAVSAGNITATETWVNNKVGGAY